MYVFHDFFCDLHTVHVRVCDKVFVDKLAMRILPVSFKKKLR